MFVFYFCFCSLRTSWPWLRRLSWLGVTTVSWQAVLHTNPGSPPRSTLAIIHRDFLPGPEQLLRTDPCLLPWTWELPEHPVISKIGWFSSSLESSKSTGPLLSASTWKPKWIVCMMPATNRRMRRSPQFLTSKYIKLHKFEIHLFNVTNCIAC